MTIREDPPPNARIAGRRQPTPTSWTARLAGAVATPGEWHKVDGLFTPSVFRHLVGSAKGRTAWPPLPKVDGHRWEFRAERLAYTHREVIYARLVPDTETTEETQR